MTTIAQLAQKRMIDRALQMPPAGEPAFHVQLATNYNGNGCLLQWDRPAMDASTFPEWRLLGRYACYPVAPRHDGGPLLPVVVELPLDAAREILEAFTSGTVRNEAVQALRQAIQKVSNQ
jgi:hypothetical protein